MGITYQTYRRYLKQRFGGKVLKVSLNGGFSCPNRSGASAQGGCIFCDNRSFSPASLQPDGALTMLKRVIDYNTNTNPNRFSAYIAYLQPFSNSYGSVEQLRSVYEPLIAEPGVVGLAIGTRPDCFAPGVVEYLAELSTRTSLSVELGLQSAHNATLKRIARGHSVEEFTARVEQLARHGVETVAHVMLGLPGEDEEMMLQTAALLQASAVSGVKIHQTMVIADTPLATAYQRGEYHPLELERYATILARFLQRLGPQKYIHRLMANSTLEHGLIAPLWSADKIRSLRTIHSILEGYDEKCTGQSV